jgi:hypothetical protein
VGQEEETLPSVRSSGSVVRSEQTPLRIEPELGKGLEDIEESVLDESGDILKEDPSGLDSLDGCVDERPQPPVVGLASSLACCTERLARETGRDEIHSVAVEVAREGREIVPDRCAIQGLFFHPRHESGC